MLYTIKKKAEENGSKEGVLTFAFDWILQLFDEPLKVRKITNIVNLYAEIKKNIYKQALKEGYI